MARRKASNASVQLAVNSSEIEHIDATLKDHTEQDARHFASLHLEQREIRDVISGIKAEVAETKAALSGKIDKIMIYGKVGMTAATVLGGIVGPLIVNYLIKHFG